jgi:hypothetical protein
MDTDDFIATTVGVSLGVYLGAVVWNNNVSTLITKLSTEGGYIEFIIAIGLLMAVHTFLPGQQVTDLITLIAILAVILVAMKNTQITSALTQFGHGQITMLQTVQEIAGVKPIV